MNTESPFSNQPRRKTIHPSIKGKMTVFQTAKNIPSFDNNFDEKDFKKKDPKVRFVEEFNDDSEYDLNTIKISIFKGFTHYNHL